MDRGDIFLSGPVIAALSSLAWHHSILGRAQSNAFLPAPGVRRYNTVVLGSEPVSLSTANFPLSNHTYPYTFIVSGRVAGTAPVDVTEGYLDAAESFLAAQSTEVTIRNLQDATTLEAWTLLFANRVTPQVRLSVEQTPERKQECENNGINGDFTRSATLLMCCDR